MGQNSSDNFPCYPPDNHYSSDDVWEGDISHRLWNFISVILAVQVLWHCLLGDRKGIRPVKNGRWWRWALVGPDGVAPNRMVSVSASVNLPLLHKVQKFFSGTGSPGWSRKKGRKRLWCDGLVVQVEQSVRCVCLSACQNSNLWTKLPFT